MQTAAEYRLGRTVLNMVSLCVAVTSNSFFGSLNTSSKMAEHVQNQRELCKHRQKGSFQLLRVQRFSKFQ